MAIDILLFITWKTRGSWHLIDETRAEQLLRLLPGLALTAGVRIIELAVVSTHIHLVLRSGGTLDLPRVIQRLKGSSARIMNRGAATDARLQWDPGYDARSVSRRNMMAIRRYFDAQARHHNEPWVALFDRRPQSHTRHS